MAPAASRACAAVSATTIATASPAIWTRFAGRGNWSRTCGSPPPGANSVGSVLELGMGLFCSGSRPASCQSFPVRMRRTPGHGLRCSSGLFRVISRMGMWRSQHRGVGLTRHIPVVTELARAGDQAEVFIADNRLANIFGHASKLLAGWRLCNSSRVDG